MRSLKIVRIDGPQRREMEDLITEEISLRLLAGHRRLAELLCSPQDLEDLVVGFFYTNGLIRHPQQILEVVVNRASGSAFIDLAPEIDPDELRLSDRVGSACGASLQAEAAVPFAPEGEAARPPFTVSAGRISGLMEELRRRSEIHRRTGGVHAAALAALDGPEGVLVFREDIGRHNAVDKAVGALLAAGRSTRDTLLLSSGRLSSEILQKAARCGIPVLVSRGAPTDRAVALARQWRITLVGFARGRRMNLYSLPDRIVV